MNFLEKLSSEPPAEIQEAIQEIEAIVRKEGLDFFQTIFEMVDYEQMSEIAAYGGFPTRYPHWHFGMEYERISKSYEYGLSLIYEMVINNDPCYAYLLKSNPIVDQKTVIAHVYGHCDFFKNNVCFANTNRKMLNEMANHGSRIRHYIEEIGQDTVESFIDICLSLENLIDLHHPHIRRERKKQQDDNIIPKNAAKEPIPKLKTKHSYMDRYINPEQFLKEQQQKIAEGFERSKNFPEHPKRDILEFLGEHAPLNAWQKDVLSIIREEAYYFAPQGQTKIMNEGWAVYWQSEIMTKYVMKDSEVIDYCDHYSGVLQSNPQGLNPYKIGLELMRYIEERWNKGKFGIDFVNCQDPQKRRLWDKKTNLGREKLFEVRKIYNDVTFVDAFFDEDFCEDSKIFAWISDKRSGKKLIHEKEFPIIKKNLLDSITNFGQPIIDVVDGNFHNRSELLLRHKHIGTDLKIDEAFETLKNLYSLWTRPVHIETIIDDETKIMSFDGTETKIERSH